jgi:hypothetical protein
MTPRRILQIRFWLLAVAGLLWCCFAPEAFGVLVYGGFAMTPLGLMMPVFAAGGGTCPTACTANPASVSVSFSGVANGTCATCSTYNAGFAVLWTSGCSGVATITSCGAASATASFAVGTSGGNVTVSTTLAVALSSTSFQNLSVASAPTDCTALGSVAVSQTAFSNGACNYSVATSAIAF